MTMLKLSEGLHSGKTKSLDFSAIGDGRQCSCDREHNHVLGVALPGANVSKAATQLQTLANNWSAAGTSTTVTLANAGIPVPAVSAPTSGSGPTILAAARAALIAMGAASPREIYSADVVIFFVGGVITGSCGYAETKWRDPLPNEFTPGANGLDLLAADGNTSSAGWAAVVTTEVGCDPYPEVALHEFGHLLGAGHYEPVRNPSHWLYYDSLAYAFAQFISWPVNGWVAARTIMATPAATPCLAAPNGCAQTMTFSNLVASRDNVRTLATTAQSVANYRVTAPPSCSITRPDDLVGTLTGICTPWPWTRHFMNWDDDCPEETIIYDVFGSQPVGSPYQYGWSTALRATEVYVYGANANMKVRACNAGQCSPLSSETYLALSLCFE